jgi:regulator of cell morphogenesis and NO signaling
MTDISQRTLGDLVIANPSRARILERHGLDHCCGGRRTLKEACAAAGLDEQVVQADLGASEVDPADWVELDPPALARHIADTHHRYLHEELPLLDALAEKVLMRTNADIPSSQTYGSWLPPSERKWSRT